MAKEERFIELVGDTSQFMIGNSDSTVKCTRLVDIDPNETNVDRELIDICITSTSMRGDHKIFNKLIGKKIRITVDILD